MQWCKSHPYSTALDVLHSLIPRPSLTFQCAVTSCCYRSSIWHRVACITVLDQRFKIIIFDYVRCLPACVCNNSEKLCQKCTPIQTSCCQPRRQDLGGPYFTRLLESAHTGLGMRLATACAILCSSLVNPRSRALLSTVYTVTRAYR